MNEKDITLITGQSGLSIARCIKKVKNNFPSLDMDIFSLDHKIEEILNQDFIDVLGYPPKLLYEYWDMAFEKISEEYSVSDKKNKIINLHTSYYHQQKRQFISAINFKKFFEWKYRDRIKSIVVLVDDCYDIYKRLSSDGKMFDYIYNLKPKKALFHSISNLILILMWREIETAFSHKIAQLLDIPIFIFAMKHPISLFERLIKNPIENLKFVYLSHPISSVRAEKQVLHQEFIEELNSFIKQILDANPNLILFIPDTIDEKRIETKSLDSEKIFIPELKDHWKPPYGSKNWLFEPLPSDVENKNPLNPLNYHKKEDEDSISQTLSILAEKIGDQINSRDISLVEQCQDGLIVYRPCWEGFVASGVIIEVEYNCFLRKSKIFKKQLRRIIVLGTENDMGKLRIRKLFNQLEYDIKDCNEKVFQEMGEKWANSPERVLNFSRNNCVWNDIRKETEKNLPKNYIFSSGVEGTLGPGKLLETHKIHEKYWDDVKKNIQNISLDYLEFDDKFDKKIILSHSDELNSLVVDKAVEFVNRNLE